MCVINENRAVLREQSVDLSFLSESDICPKKSSPVFLGKTTVSKAKEICSSKF